MEIIRKPSVAIVDDNRRGRERFADFMLSEGYDPVVFDHGITSIKDLLREANSKKIDYGIFDHRLSEGRYASFLGAEGVSTFNDNLKASILVTGYERDDCETTIRQHRKKIPVLLHMSEVNASELNLGLRKVYSEILKGEVPIERQPCRSILTVVDMIQKGKITVVKVIVGQWSPDEPIGFPLDMLPEDLRTTIKIDDHLIANVNVDALKSEDIYFENFKLPNKNALSQI